MEPNLEDVLAEMVSILQPFVPAQVAGLPKPSLSLVHAETRGAGIGNYVGMSTDGSIATVEHHAIRVQAVARFVLWGTDPFSVDQAVMALNASVFTKRDDLRTAGFLKLAFDGTTQAGEIAGLAAWQRNADYDVLYEFAYADAGEASSLLVRVPVDETSSGQHWTVLGDIARWDDQQTPALSVRGPAEIAEIAALAFFSNVAREPTGPVRLARTYDGAPAPTDSGTLAAFIAQTTAAVPARNVYVDMPTLSALLATFTPNGPPLDLGGPDDGGAPRLYIPTRYTLPSPIVLPAITDRLELSYQQPPFDRLAVVYIRASRRGG